MTDTPITTVASALNNARIYDDTKTGDSLLQLTGIKKSYDQTQVPPARRARQSADGECVRGSVRPGP